MNRVFYGSVMFKSNTPIEKVKNMACFFQKNYDMAARCRINERVNTELEIFSECDRTSWDYDDFMTVIVKEASGYIDYMYFHYEDHDEDDYLEYTLLSENEICVSRGEIKYSDYMDYKITADGVDY